METQPDLIANNPLPTVYPMKMHKAAMTCMVMVYARVFLHHSSIKDFLKYPDYRTIQERGYHYFLPTFF